MPDANASQASLSRALGAGAAYAAMVFAFAFVTGAIRTIITSQNFGITPLGGVLIELPIILLFAWKVCDSVMRWTRVSPDLGIRLLTSATALIVMLVAEYSLSALVLGRSLPEFLATYAQPEALIGLAGQVVFATFPLFRWRPL
ncbi:MAG: hypothetical protein ABMA14_11630 [Hyphomonadaceae bacterium]